VDLIIEQGWNLLKGYLSSIKKQDSWEIGRRGGWRNN
jgi:hypothetical protein